MKKASKKKAQNKLDRILDLPIEVSTNEPKVTIISFEKLLVENYKGILEYDENMIKIGTYIGIINIVGRDMTLNEMTSDDVMVKGEIDSIDFESIE